MSELPAKPDLPAIAEDLYCQKCGYNLRGLTGEICPECGGSLAGVRASVSPIPSVHRKELGWWRAYWKTVFFVMFRQRQFAEEMARPVSYRDSQLFRWVTVLTAYVPIVFVAVWGAERVSATFRDDMLGPFWILASLLIGYFLLLGAATGVPSYFFHPTFIPISQQNRAIALSYYTCAPLAVSIVPASAALVSLKSRAGDSWELGFLLIAGFVALLQLVSWWSDLIRLARRIIPQRPRRAALVAIGVPVVWLFLAVFLTLGTVVLLNVTLILVGTLLSLLS